MTGLTDRRPPTRRRPARPAPVIAHVVIARVLIATLIIANLIIIGPAIGWSYAFAAAATEPARLGQCGLTGDGRAWVQGILDDWQWVMGDVLGRQPETPWMILFDSGCVFEVGGPPVVSPEETRPQAASAEPAAGPEGSLRFGAATVSARARPHDGTVELPSGDEIPAGPMAAGFVQESEDSVAPFFALAMVDIWRQVPGAADDPDLDAFFAGVAIHEMVHTLQLVRLSARIDELRGRHELPERFNDDIVQDTFQEDPEFRAAFEAERDLFFAAALTEDDAVARTLVLRALTALRDRRARFFRDEYAGYGKLEDLFLNMEGLAVWAHYRLATHDPDVVFLSGETSREPAALIERARAGQGYWSQEEGFGLALLLDRFVPGWLSPTIDELASPVELLEAALDADAAAEGR